ncbi:ScbA/BarX family gamma-butyrolactone biosynthesis protein [Tsukamurella sp. 1534]|uniref:ScbA/BarX family gamma-butyrolactone biosynthesis protein n=1 Tax=Tsukamurella sp. 1534 TaxID=1151061 RepID=UPI0003128B51|nr:ScbA/BarX family gamma-butyrolactone biosynthesis protein [Tsukamurella sp. 1534]
MTISSAHGAAGEDRLSCSPDIEHDRTVPRQLVHRCAVSEVFLTSFASEPRVVDGVPVYTLGAQLPRAHAYYGDHRGPQAGHHDPLAVMEVARQAGIAVSHEFFGVPMDHAFLVRVFDGVAVPGPRWEAGSEPADLTVDLRVTREHVADGRRTGLDVVMDIASEGEPMMTILGSLSWMPPRAWTGMRRTVRERMGLGQRPTGVHPATPGGAAEVGREARRNVVIGAVSRSGARAEAPLVVDTTHPSLFDHPLDHVPGSLLLEAARQFAVATAGSPTRRAATLRSRFDAFVELDVATTCHARMAGSPVGSGVAGAEDAPDSVVVRVEQAGRTCAEIEVEFVPVPAEGAVRE